MTSRVPTSKAENSLSSAAASAKGHPSHARIQRRLAARLSGSSGAASVLASVRIASGPPSGSHEQSGSLVCLAPAEPEKAEESSPSTRWREPASRVKMSAYSATRGMAVLAPKP